MSAWEHDGYDRLRDSERDEEESADAYEERKMWDRIRRQSDRERPEDVDDAE